MLDPIPLASLILVAIVLQIVYFDGQFNDSRMNVALACSAAHGGATITNHTEVLSLIKV